MNLKNWLIYLFCFFNLVISLFNDFVCDFECGGGFKLFWLFLFFEFLLKLLVIVKIVVVY